MKTTICEVKKTWDKINSKYTVWKERLVNLKTAIETKLKHNEKRE